MTLWDRIRAGCGLFALVGAVLLNMLLLTAIAPILSTIAQHFGAQDPGGGSGAQITTQMIVTLTGLGIMIASPVSGWLADRFGPKAVMIGAFALYGVAGSAGLFIESQTTLLAARFVQGMSASGIAVTSYAMIGWRFQGAQRGRVLGYQAAIVAAAGFVTGLGAGQLAEWGGWRAPFGLYLFGFVMLAMALIGSGLPSGRQAATKSEEAAAPGGSLLSIWHLYLMLVPLYAAGFMFYLQLSFVMAADGITGPGRQAQILSVITVLHFVTGLFYGRIVERLGTRRTFVAILLVMAAGNLAVGLGQGVPAMVIGCAFIGLSAGSMVPFIINLITTRAPPGQRSRALGIMYALSYIGQFLNPLLITPLRGAIGDHQAFLVVGLLLLAAALAQGLLPRSVSYELAAKPAAG